MVTETTKTWKGKWTDVLLVLFYFILYGIGVHILVSIRHAIRNGEDIMESILSPGQMIFSIVLLMFFMSPFWIYFRKVPRMMRLDTEKRTLDIQRRRKTLHYKIDKIRYHARSTRFFYILEIHATFYTKKRGEFEKMATSIIVPNWGLSWNKKVMENIVHELKDAQIEEIENRPTIPVSEYFYN